MLEGTSKSKTPNIGDRIEYIGHLGTIKYIGPVDGHSSIWLGVDWDNVNRGKHDGSINGNRYFTATYPKSGSFVRPEKVRLGQSAVAAIRSRYGRHDDDSSTEINEQQLRKFQQSINAPFLKFVGFDKITDMQSDFFNLKVVNLREQNIFTPGGPNGLRNLCPNILELDISKNLINNWTIIFDICSQLNSLEWLNVSENNLMLPEDLSSFCYTSPEILICAHLNISWSDILKLSYIFPNVQDLRIPNNGIKCLETPLDKYFQNLKILNLENNPIEDWDEILKLTVLSNIEQLCLENNGLKCIKFNCKPKADQFVNLTKLVLTNNLIDDWESVGELNKLCKLEELKFFKNPILETENLNVRTQLIIAKIANLKSLNGSLITLDERRGAEYDYVKKYSLEYLAVRNDSEKLQSFLEKHNRYRELMEECGIPDESELTTQSNVIEESLIDLNITYLDITVIKRLPPTMLVEKLVMLVKKLFNISNRPNLVYLSGTKTDIEIVLDDDIKELGYYSMLNGDKILVTT